MNIGLLSSKFAIQKFDNNNFVKHKYLFTYFSLACASEGALEPFPLAYMPGPSSVMDGCDMIQNYSMPFDAKNLSYLRPTTLLYLLRLFL